jgi:hypothetical protein
MLYDIRCQAMLVRPESQPGHEDLCYENLPVVKEIHQPNGTVKVMSPSSRVLLTSSGAEPCFLAQKAARAFETVEENWVALTPPTVNCHPSVAAPTS